MIDKLGLDGLGGKSVRVKCDHKAATRLANNWMREPYTAWGNFSACYLDSQAQLADLTQRHAKLLELAEASLKEWYREDTDKPGLMLDADAALRQFIEEERKRTP